MDFDAFSTNRKQGFTIDEKVELAARAHIRYQHTDFAEVLERLKDGYREMGERYDRDEVYDEAVGEVEDEVDDVVAGWSVPRDGVVGAGPGAGPSGNASMQGTPVKQQAGHAATVAAQARADASSPVKEEKKVVKEEKKEEIKDEVKAEVKPKPELEVAVKLETA